MKGFSLVEILVAIGIIGILGAVSIPGLRNFSKTQDIDNTASQVVNVLRTAQSSAMAGVKCPDNTTVESWIVSIRESNYLLRCRNTTGAVIDLPTYTYSPSGSGVSNLKGATHKDGNPVCSPGVSNDIVFTAKTVRYLCNLGGNYGAAPFNILIQNSANSTLKTINVEAGGIIRIQ